LTIEEHANPANIKINAERREVWFLLVWLPLRNSGWSTFLRNVGVISHKVVIFMIISIYAAASLPSGLMDWCHPVLEYE
jgi:hypothetical protein